MSEPHPQRFLFNWLGLGLGVSFKIITRWFSDAVAAENYWFGLSFISQTGKLKCSEKHEDMCIISFNWSFAELGLEPKSPDYPFSAFSLWIVDCPCPMETWKASRRVIRFGMELGGSFKLREAKTRSKNPDTLEESNQKWDLKCRTCIVNCKASYLCQ